jgi:hypothetical protein
MRAVERQMSFGLWSMASSREKFFGGCLFVLGSCSFLTTKSIKYTKELFCQIGIVIVVTFKKKLMKIIK